MNHIFSFIVLYRSIHKRDDYSRFLGILLPEKLEIYSKGSKLHNVKVEKIRGQDQFENANLINQGRLPCYQYSTSGGYKNEVDRMNDKRIHYSHQDYMPDLMMSAAFSAIP